MDFLNRLALKNITLKEPRLNQLKQLISKLTFINGYLNSRSLNNQPIKNRSIKNWLPIKRQTNRNSKRMHQAQHQIKRDEVAHFCEHDGINIHFTKARPTWHAMAPCALKPWWLFLKPIKKNL